MHPQRRTVGTVRVNLTAANVMYYGKGSETDRCCVPWSSLFLYVTLRRLAGNTDVSGQPVGPICRGQAVQQDMCRHTECVLQKWYHVVRLILFFFNQNVPGSMWNYKTENPLICAENGNTGIAVSYSVYKYKQT